jgi:hypothetical protein
MESGGVIRIKTQSMILGPGFAFLSNITETAISNGNNS